MRGECRRAPVVKVLASRRHAPNDAPVIDPHGAHKGKEEMDQEMLKLLAQFRILLKKEKGIHVDFERLAGDPAYARELVKAGEDCDNEVLVMLALQLHEKLGLMAAPKPAPVPAKAVSAEKYKFGARS
jgi:hypothetical protein